MKKIILAREGVEPDKVVTELQLNSVTNCPGDVRVPFLRYFVLCYVPQLFPPSVTPPDRQYTSIRNVCKEISWGSCMRDQ